MQPAINKIGSHIHQQRPFNCVCNHKADFVFAQQIYKFRYNKALVAYFNTVPHRTLSINLRPVPAPQCRPMRFGHLRCRCCCQRQQTKKPFKSREIKSEIWRELPQNWAKLLVQAQQTLRKKIRQRLFYLTQTALVRYVPRSFYGKNKVFRRFGSPPGKGLRPLHGVKRAVNFNRRKFPAGIFQFALLGQLWWIKPSPPARITPPGNPDSDLARALHSVPCGCVDGWIPLPFRCCFSGNLENVLGLRRLCLCPFSNLFRHSIEVLCFRRTLSQQRNRQSTVTSHTDLRIKFDCAQKRNIELLCCALCSAFGENINLLMAMRTREMAHVLNNPKHLDIHLMEHLQRLARILQ